MRALYPILIAVLFGSLPLHAQNARVDAGARIGVSAADGKPANDMPGAGILAHYLLNEDWALGGALDYTEFDFEEPAKLLGIVQDQNVGPVDALAESVAVRVWIERRLGGSVASTRAFIAAGLGAASLDVPDVDGPRADGGRFDIQTDAGTEILAFILGGLRVPLGDRWYAEAGLTLEQHFADWDVVDRVTGVEGGVDDYLSWGVYGAVGLRF